MINSYLDHLYDYSLNVIFHQYAITSYDDMGMKSCNWVNRIPPY